jgi:hypothetical protein
LLFFRFPGPGAGCSPLRVLTALPCAGANPAWRHPTPREARAPPGERVQSPVGGRLCGLAMMLCPRTVLGQGGAEPGSSPVRGRLGREAAPVTVAPSRRLCRSQRGWPSNGPRLRASRPLRPLGRAQTQAHKTASTLDGGGARRGPVRRQAHPRCSLSQGGPSPEPRLGGVGASQRRPARACGPGWGGLYPCPGASPHGPGACALLG